MAGTRRQIESSVTRPKRRSLLRDTYAWPVDRDFDKRPAGPSSTADPGMGSPTQPLPPGMTRQEPSDFAHHPKIAGVIQPETVDREGLGPESADLQGQPGE